VKLALFSPLPPSRSGIADYSEELLRHLTALAEVRTCTEADTFAPGDDEMPIYQLGNNPHHIFAYEAALRHPGIVVLHEANLHHLLADLTIKRGDWDGYLREVEIDGGKQALAYAVRWVATRRRGPDYALPLLTSVLKSARGVIVHSEAVAEGVRGRGYTGPLAKIPHGAWTATVDGSAYRKKLGVDSATPLFGIFGFLKPYKRIRETLAAFERLVAMHAEARLVLVGEAHPELKLELGPYATHIDYAPIDDFSGYLAACDAIVNLRFPTVGETSGTLLRAFGLGKATMVSDIGSFREYPDEICLKVPIGSGEEEHIFEYLRLLAERPDVRSALGKRAKAWVERECNWPSVARRYVEFAQSVVQGNAGPVSVPVEYVLGWTKDADGSRSYAKTHATRLKRTLDITPRGGAQDRVLEMGAYLQITPALRSKLGYGEVRGCYFGELGRRDERAVESETGEVFQCVIDHFDAEKDRFPYDDGSFATVLCCELVEHLPSDPMHMMSEIHRILRVGGHLVMTTPNVASLRAVSGILQGFHPMLFPAYIRPNPGGDPDPRHAREYTALEIQRLLEDAGFTVELLETGPFLDEPTPELGWVSHLLGQYMLTQEHRGDGIYVVGRKTGEVRERYPAWLYQ
jgi:glycosyltransferase involved in cell wall biosynthesis/SAM-dependent methyltransferase